MIQPDFRKLAERLAERIQTQDAVGAMMGALRLIWERGVSDGMGHAGYQDVPIPFKPTALVPGTDGTSGKLPYETPTLTPIARVVGPEPMRHIRVGDAIVPESLQAQRFSAVVPEGQTALVGQHQPQAEITQGPMGGDEGEVEGSEVDGADGPMP